ncbi:tRNA (adenosine(37)-N6)-threonylcarbamoyltransferase complex transferase subunit TsaD [Candidatus Dependentiae bacterium]|nr:tRNA (adenosine(37)-N6)-threonylcarbamoyltransferase complex transferase subunit TsaD [Candidatus Dependentiae bacterium]
MALTVLGIETSCDETVAAVYQEGRGIVSNELFSQIDLHKLYGGVMPEIASRAHLEKINEIVAHALKKANVTLDDVDVVAVTCKPGLPGSLLVGVCFAKAIAWAKHKKLIGVNHLEGHAFSAFLEHDVPFPHICITASGGHTSMYLVHDFGKYEVLGTTMDDAAGEAFDKIAKLIDLPYPGGPEIEKLAREVNFQDFFHYPRGRKKRLDFSFSGLKTAVLYDLVKKNAYDMQTKIFLKKDDELFKQQVASSLLVCITDIFKEKVKLALKEHPHVKALTFVGGVACNKYIKQELKMFCEKRRLQFYTPSAQYCTDNAAMIAFVGYYKAKKNHFSDFDLDIF